MESISPRMEDQTILSGKLDRLYMIQKRLVLKIFFGSLILIGLIFFITPFFHDGRKTQKDFFLNSLLYPKNPEKQLRTGDILLWTTTSMKSVLIQEMTDGPYSHCALLYRNSDGRVWVLDTYPHQGLRYMPLDYYLEPQEHPMVKIGIMRYRGDLNLSLLEKRFQTLVKHKEQIGFDNKMVYDGSKFDLNNLGQKPYEIYCAELIFEILKDCTLNSGLYENDYDRVMTKWEIFSAEGKRKDLPLVNTVKLFYLKSYLGKLKEDSNKVLISPNGFIRSGAFKLINEIQGPVEIGAVKKYLGRMPKIPGALAERKVSDDTQA